MSLVDYEAAWLGLKAEVVTKRSHGRDGLLQAMARLEIDNRVPEGQEAFDPGPASSPPGLLLAKERNGVG